MLDTLTQRASTLGDEAAHKARDRIIARTDPPPGVQVQAIEGGIEFTGKQLRRRFITNSNLRNFTR